VKLCLRPIESDLPATSKPAEVPPSDQELWRDSSLDLERGLDVIELHIDIPLDQERLTVYTGLKRRSPIDRAD
jgi:hypothetical protein